MNRLRLSGLLLAVTALSVTSGRAQTPPATVAGMSVRLMSWEGELSDLLLADGTTFLPARAGEFILGRAVFLNRKTPTMRVFREQTVEGAKRKLPVADVPLPEGTSSVLVMLAPAPAGSALPIQGRALDQSLEVHPLNTVRIVNFSNRTLALRVGEKTSVSAPGADDRFPFPAGGAPQVPVEVAVNTPEGWQLVQRSLQPAPAGRRILVVVRDGRPDLSIQDPSLRTKPVDAVFLIDRAPPAPVSVAQK
ncbi:MAG: hypothetical protein ACAH89_11250 [Rariglobus sp.]|nr:hypothetical protein [Rariglobus sp.]